MRIIRNKVFETNSSSCHSISLNFKGSEANSTNSSSTIWDSILDDYTKDLENLLVTKKDDTSSFSTPDYEVTLPIKLIGGDFGWEFYHYHHPIDKLNYALIQFCPPYTYDSKEELFESNGWKRFTSLFKHIDYFSFDGLERLGIEEFRTVRLKFEFDVDWKEFKSSYIDHESQGLLGRLSDEELLDLVYDPRNLITTDADG